MAIPVLSMRERAATIVRVLRSRLGAVLPAAMAESGLDMWIILCQEDDLDPVYRSMIPLDTWCPILQMLVFYNPGNGRPIERMNISGTDTHDLYERPHTGQLPDRQWELLREIIESRDPQRIGINTGAVAWAAGGLTLNLYNQLCDAIPERFVGRFESAEQAAVLWLETVSGFEIEAFEHVVRVAREILSNTLSAEAIVPGITTIDDLVWHYWQQCADLGLDVSFKPHFDIVRATRDDLDGEANVIRRGDLIHSDVGIRYLGLNSDHQEWAYVLRAGEVDAPDSMQRLLREANRLQDIMLSSFETGISGNDLLSRSLSAAREAGIESPRIYSHSLGHYLHEPGPLIGLPWEQERCPGRGDVVVRDSTAYAMELSVDGAIPEWDDEVVRLSVEQDVVFVDGACRLLDGRQTAFHLV